MQVFEIAAAGKAPFWILLPALLILAGVATLIVVTVQGANGARFELTSEGLRLRGDLYGRFIPREQLNVAGARRVAPSETDLKPRLRTLGTGLPGYRAGWFRLKNGEKALLYLTDESRAVYIPTTAGYSVLLSPQDPDGFLRALQQQ